MTVTRGATTVETRAGRRGRTVLLLALASCAAVVLAGTAFAFHLGPSTTVRASVSSAGAEGGGDSSEAAVSDSGRYVAFTSQAANLVAGDTNSVADIFVRDLQSGATTRVSVSSAGAEATAASGQPSISADGRFVAFQSHAANLIARDRNGSGDIFVRDRTSGTTTRVNVSSAGAEANGPSFFSPSISANGRYVAFESGATNLVAGDTNDLADVFVRDRQSGTTTRVNLSSTGAQSDGEGYSYVTDISADGRYVAFESRATTLVPGDTNGVYDVFVRDRQTAETTRVSVSSAGVQGDRESRNPAISADGRHVVFYSEANNLVPGDSGDYDMFVHDRQTAETTCVSRSPAGTQADGASAGRSAISADGRYVAFQSGATNLVPGDKNAAWDIFVRDRVIGETTLVSVSSAGAAGDGDSESPSISSDGRHVAFASLATSLVSGDEGGHRDVFVRDCMKASSAIIATSTSTTLSKYGGAYTLTGRLDSAGAPLAGRTVVLQRAARSVGPWTTTAITALSAADGGFSLAHVPRSKTYYRARFAREGLDHDACTSAVRYALPRAWLSAPAAPATMSANQARAAHGYLKPRHTAGTFAVRIYKYRLVSGVWRGYGYVKAKASNYSTYTKYSGSVTLPYAGKWRLRAYHPTDAGHAGSWSAGFDYVTVR